MSFSGRGRPGRVERFVDENRKLLERRLADECLELGRGLGGLADVLASAVGTEGRGGGRWRPLLTLGAAAAYGAGRNDALDAAIAVELTHTASLALDDLPCMDDSALRRGQPATHQLVGSAGAILLSVSLLARAAELLGRHRDAGGELAEQWGRAIGLHGMAGGQAMDVAAKGPMRGARRRLHREKSTALPAFALWAGARVANAGTPACQGLVSFGRSLGWAYQLLDDAEDVDEDGRLGRLPGGRQPLSLSQRIMRRAYRRLRDVTAPGGDGVEILIGLAGLVVIPEAVALARSPHTTGWGED